MNFKQIEAFVTAAEQGSFSKAAVLLYTSPTALTQQLNALERYLQCTVLERSYRGVRLTPAGKTFYEYAKRMMQLADDAVVACRTEVGFLNKKITIGIYREIEITLLLPYLNRFSEICPDIEFSFLNENHRVFYDLLKNREIDFFVYPRDEHIEKDGFCFQKMGTTNVCCIFAQEHPLAEKERIGLENLRGKSVIVSCGCKSRVLDNLIDHLKKHEPDVLMKACNSDEEIWMNIFRRDHVMISLDFCYHPPAGCLLRKLDWPKIIEYGLIHRMDDSAATKRFLSYMKTACGKEL